MRQLLSVLLLLELGALITFVHATDKGTFAEPEQKALPQTSDKIFKNGWTLKPLATFSVEARVLAIKPYKGQATDELAPFDLALGWGLMARSGISDKIVISQKNRFYQWHYWGSTFTEEQIIRSSTNAHIISANVEIEKSVSQLQVGDIVRLSGVLVEASHPQADKTWRSSLRHDDIGEGACEIIYVKSLSILK